MAKGTHAYHGDGSPRVAITFGKDLIDNINTVKDHESISFSEAVRRICRQHFEAA